MTTNRRKFIGQLTTGAAAFGALPLTNELLAGGVGIGSSAGAAAASDEWDLSWTGRVKGKYKAVFDVPEIESGLGVWRASIYVNQYRDVLGAKETQITPVLVIRHVAIVLAMKQEYWDRYDIGKTNNVRHPLTQEPTDRNPALLSSKRNEAPEMFDAFALDQYLARGRIALACDLAFQLVIMATIKAHDKVEDDEARKRGLAMMVPGVVLQPSGVFAALRAQEVGGAYLRATCWHR
jgi:hypothetical protein